MEKVREVKDRVLEAGKKGKEKLEDVQKKEWAEPTGTALKAAAGVASLIPPPFGDVIKGALSLGATVLNPDPSLADLRRAKEEIKDEMKTVFTEVAKDMSEIHGKLSTLDGKAGDVLRLICDREFFEHIDNIDAHHQYFMEGLHNLEDTYESFKLQEASFQISFNKHFKVEKIHKYLKIIQQREGNEACEKYYNDNIVSYGKYLQVLFVYLTFKGDLNRIKTLLENFLRNHQELASLYMSMRVIPEDEAAMKRKPTNREKIGKPGEIKEVFSPADVVTLHEMAKDLDLKASTGQIKEASAVFNDIFEMMKTKNFSESQKPSQCAVYSKIVRFHNAKSCFDEAITYTAKLMDFTDENTPTVLKIEVCTNSAIAFANKGHLRQAKALAGTAVALAREDFGENSMTYANALIVFAKFLPPEKNFEALTSAQKVIESKEGTESVAAADILSNIAWSNFCLRRASPITLGRMIKDVVRNKYREPTKQAEKALEIMIKELGSDNTRVIGTKITLAALIQENAREEFAER